MIVAAAIAVSLAASGSAATIYNAVDPSTPTTVLSPAGVFSFQGTNLCPLTVAYEIATPSRYPTTLGGCTLTIDGVNAPLTYVSPNEIRFIALGSGSTVAAAGQSVAVTYATSTPRFVMTYQINGAPIPMLKAANGTLQGSLQNPLTYNPLNPGGNFVIASVNAVGLFAGTAPGTTNSGFCAVLPTVAIDGVVLQYLKTPNGNGADVPYCQQANAVALLGLEIPQSFPQTKQHLLTIVGGDGVVQTAVIY